MVRLPYIEGGEIVLRSNEARARRFFCLVSDLIHMCLTQFRAFIRYYSTCSFNLFRSQYTLLAFLQPAY